MTEYQMELMKRINNLELMMTLKVFTPMGFDVNVAALKETLKEDLEKGKKAA